MILGNSGIRCFWEVGLWVQRWRFCPLYCFFGWGWVESYRKGDFGSDRIPWIERGLEGFGYGNGDF